MSIGADTTEDNVEDPQKKNKNRTTIQLSSSSGHLSEENENIHSKRCMHLFTAASLTTAKIWKQPKYPLICKSTTEYY